MRIAPSGVRSSCEIMAMNSSFARFDASASVRAAASRRTASPRAWSASSRAASLARSSRSRMFPGRTSSAPASKASARSSSPSMPHSSTGTARATGSERSSRSVSSAWPGGLAVRMRSGGRSRTRAATAAPSGSSVTSKRGPSEARSRSRAEGGPPTRRSEGGPFSGASFMALTVQHSHCGVPSAPRNLHRPVVAQDRQARAGGRPRGTGAGSSSKTLRGCGRPDSATSSRCSWHSRHVLAKGSAFSRGSAIFWPHSAQSP